MAEAPPKDFLRSTLNAIGALGGAAALLAFAVAGARPAAGVFCGAVLATLNFWAFARLGRGLLESSTLGIPWGVLMAVKLLVLFAAVILLLKHEIVQPIPLAIGYLVLPIGIVASQLTQTPDRNGGPA